MYLLSQALEYGAPLFLITSPVTSYADQILSIHRSRSSAGFSMDIPLIMLVASILKVFYWFGAKYSFSLLVQAVFTIGVQIVLLKVALDNRPSPGLKNSVEHVPFSSVDSGQGFTRPYDFWQWRSAKPYWMFLAYFTAALLVIQVLLPPLAYSESYIGLLGYVGLAVEATLPLPQVIKNHQSRSCVGFRLSVVIAWILGDIMKLSYFFCSAEVIPWSFRLCGMFQCVCDLYLGLQFWMYSGTSFGAAGSPSRGASEGYEVEEKDIRMT
ncbi:PQ-loop repeat-containing protein [Aspergillus saccharolyticus JOP 1030-1]|uniref:PQ loop repeat protein n=1 Tax=Aspergillus saccharolyticus JOP 1030-1 TaxID=1450539 RepID=A0A318Z6K3_9EURO|nr:PQ loop repeat protein [Aspergillus saccharolyticus JOP 1030-1]PYH42719.1 PQ loop repeat protein [Aspergillus saccharolyticus JOP 1030-1]